ncbi:MAG: hypothetical protein LLF94_05670 [Chlamydiales bacterium]|nr:hypothetical protein [Chlamydiales bacterium]
MQTTLIGQKRNSNMQEMGETREPMAFDCWTDAQKLAELYSKSLNHDFWVLYAAKPHVKDPNAIVAGWEIIAKRPPAAMVGVLVFKWCNQSKRLMVEPDLCLPYDIPISETELSNKSKDYIPSIEKAAKKSGSIVLA